MTIETDLALLDDILMPWRDIIGDDFHGYRNHCCRMVNCCLALQECDKETKNKLMIAAAFHDIGIWTEKTLDYLPPSVTPALAYLQENDLQQWTEEITLMIAEHHKLSEYSNQEYPLVELFRKGDLVDFSLGMIRFGLPKAFIRELKKTYPNAGFHRRLMKLGGLWLIRHPLNPLPMMKR
jgi:hypothetical protein